MSSVEERWLDLEAMLIRAAIHIPPDQASTEKVETWLVQTKAAVLAYGLAVHERACPDCYGGCGKAHCPERAKLVALGKEE